MEKILLILFVSFSLPGWSSSSTGKSGHDNERPRLSTGPTSTDACLIKEAPPIKEPDPKEVRRDQWQRYAQQLHKSRAAIPGTIEEYLSRNIQPPPDAQAPEGPSIGKLGVYRHEAVIVEGRRYVGTGPMAPFRITMKKIGEGGKIKDADCTPDEFRYNYAARSTMTQPRGWSDGDWVEIEHNSHKGSGRILLFSGTYLLIQVFFVDGKRISDTDVVYVSRHYGCAQRIDPPPFVESPCSSSTPTGDSQRP